MPTHVAIVTSFETGWFSNGYPPEFLIALSEQRVRSRRGLPPLPQEMLKDAHRLVEKGVARPPGAFAPLREGGCRIFPRPLVHSQCLRLAQWQSWGTPGPSVGPGVPHCATDLRRVTGP